MSGTTYKKCTLKKEKDLRILIQIRQELITLRVLIPPRYTSQTYPTEILKTKWLHQESRIIKGGICTMIRIHFETDSSHSLICPQGTKFQDW